MVKVGIVGVTGRMGAAVKSALDSAQDLQFVGGINRQSKKNDWLDVFEKSDIIIDFSEHSLVPIIAESCIKFKTPLVCGTTALTNEEFDILKSITDSVAVLYASNFCISINLIGDFIETAKRFLGDYDISILETHHKQKKDSPSGTAIFLADRAEISNDQILARRCAKVVGEHEVTFYGEKDKISFVHEVYDRSIFADGAVNGARWLVGQKAGYYSMRDFIKNG